MAASVARAISDSNKYESEKDPSLSLSLFNTSYHGRDNVQHYSLHNIGENENENENENDRQNGGTQNSIYFSSPDNSDFTKIDDRTHMNMNMNNQRVNRSTQSQSQSPPGSPSRFSPTKIPFESNRSIPVTSDRNQGLGSTDRNQGLGSTDRNQGLGSTPVSMSSPTRLTRLNTNVLVDFDLNATGSGVSCPCSPKVVHPDDFRRRLVPYADIFSKPLPVFPPPPDDQQEEGKESSVTVSSIGVSVLGLGLGCDAMDEKLNTMLSTANINTNTNTDNNTNTNTNTNTSC